MKTLSKYQIRALTKIANDEGFTCSFTSKRFDEFYALIENKLLKETKTKERDKHDGSISIHIGLEITKKGLKAIGR